MKRLLLVILGALAPFSAAVAAEDVAVLFTGRTHAMIYPCNCPVEPSGGVSRRATAIRDFARRKIPYVLLDSGDCFAGGAMDQYSQGDDLDKARTAVNLGAMKAMGYDCIALGESELNFGWEFFRKTAGQAGIPFICSNITVEGIRPYMVKKAGKVLVGIAALAPETLQKKIPGSAYNDPEAALKDALVRLEAEGCELVVLMSSLTEEESLRITEKNPGVDVLILNKPKDENIVGGREALVLKSSWQGRRLGEAVLSVSQGRIAEATFTEMVLGANIADDRKVSGIVPRCFVDANCRMTGKIGACVNPGSVSARCSFTQAPKVRLTVIEAKECLTCRTEPLVKWAQELIPGLAVDRLVYPGRRAQEYIGKFDIRVLPAYLFGKEIEGEKAFEAMKTKLVPAGEYYLVAPSVSDSGYFLSRTPVPERVDVFMSLYAQGAAQLLDNLKEFTPRVHFLAAEENGGFKAPHGEDEVTDDLRAVCVRKYYPGFYYNYLACRARDIRGAWDKCLEGVDTAPVRDCAAGDEGGKLLKDNTALNRELDITQGPAYLYGNREIFNSVPVPSKEELRKILIRK